MSNSKSNFELWTVEVVLKQKLNLCLFQTKFNFTSFMFHWTVMLMYLPPAWQHWVSVLWQWWYHSDGACSPQRETLLQCSSRQSAQCAGTISDDPWSGRKEIRKQSTPSHLSTQGTYVTRWAKTQHIPHFMKIEIRPEIGISMFNCAAVKKWKWSVVWFLSYEAKHIADAECKFLRKRKRFYVVMVKCNVSVYYRVT